jgi:hypothetical protein
MASVISEGEEIRRKVEARRDEDNVLLLLEQSPTLSQSEIAERLGWHDDAGKPMKRRAQTALAKLVGQQLIEPLRAGGYKLTKQGESETSDLRGERWREEIGSASAAAFVGSAHGLNDRTDTAPHGFADD